MKGGMEISATFKEMMENETDDGGNHQSEELSQSFICCICRDLLYKPVVLACGHISCFWCVENSMSGMHKSCCPICRNQYYHLPAICQTLHLLLLKMYPLTYKTRELQTLEDEKEMGYNSLPFQIIHPTEDKNSDQIYSSQVCINDVLCCSCMSMLYRPAVLNCGHVYCSSCIDLRESEKLKCKVCQCTHPGGVPKVCLEFDHFLEEEFPEAYSLRKDTVQMKQEQFHRETPNTSTCSEDNSLLWWDSNAKVQMGVGCDSCGMYPIIGDRYRCKDCVEEIGYDLCEDCYTNGTNLPGRYNQHHTSEHEFAIMELSTLRKTMMKLLMEQTQDMSDNFDEESVEIIQVIHIDPNDENVFETDVNQS